MREEVLAEFQDPPPVNLDSSDRNVRTMPEGSMDEFTDALVKYTMGEDKAVLTVERTARRSVGWLEVVSSLR